MLYLVDGYNVTRGDDTTRRLHPDDQRLALMRRLAARGRELLGPGEIVVVWDKGPGEEADSGSVRSVFSLHETADDVIVRLAEKHAGRVTVISSDRELRDRVRTVAGAKTPLLGSSAAFEDAEGQRRRRPRRSAAGDGLPRGHADITRELAQEWLSKDE